MSRYILEAPALVLSPRMAALLERALRVDAFRVAVRGQSPEVDQLLNDWHAVALQYDPETGSSRTAPASSVSQSVSTVAERGFSAVDSDLLTSTDVAALADCSRQAVSQAARRGRLAGTQNADGCWLFSPEAADTWISNRTGTR